MYGEAKKLHLIEAILKVEDEQTLNDLEHVIMNVMPKDDSYFTETYGINKEEFENMLNTGIAQSVLGITKPWSEVKEELLAKITKK
jgi:hypothetical protein